MGGLVAQCATLLVVAQVLLFYSFVLRARLALGRWPYPYHPDPKDLGFTVHHIVVWLEFFLVLPVAPMICGVSYHAAKELGTGARVRILSLAAFFLIASGGVVLLYVDPGRFGEWFVD